MPTPRRKALVDGGYINPTSREMIEVRGGMIKLCGNLIKLRGISINVGDRSITLRDDMIDERTE